MIIKYKIILLKNFEAYLKAHPEKHKNLDNFVSRLVIEENNLLSQYNIKDIPSLWEFDPPRLATMTSLINDSKQRNTPLTGFVFLSYFPETDDIITFGYVEKADIQEIFPAETSEEEQRTVAQRNYLLEGVGVQYNFRQRGLCKKMVKIMIDEAKKLFDYGRIYLESVSNVSTRCYMANGFQVVTYYKSKHTDTVLALDF